MNNLELAELIQSKYQKQSDFIRAFNESVGKIILDKTVLSAQLAGKRELSNGWIAAYQMFFKFLNKTYQNNLLNQHNRMQSNISTVATDSIFKNENYQIVCNHQIHQAAGTNINDFLERIKHVEYLRAQWKKTFSFYPTSKKEYEENVNIWRYVNGKRNALNNQHYVYAIAIPKFLYHFLRHTKRSQIFKPVLLGLATCYVLNPEKRAIMEDQLYDSFYEKAVGLANKYFTNVLAEVSEEEANDVHSGHLYWQKYRDCLDDAIRDYIGNTTLMPYIDASSQRTERRYGQAIKNRNEFDISCPYAYMTDSDWNTIVVNGNDTDDLHRVESDGEVFDLWKYDLGNHHLGLDILD